MAAIQKLHAREVLDSRGNPTVEVEIFTEKNKASAIVPSGASTGEHEACELRDGGDRYNGKGVLNACENVNTIINNEIKGFDVFDQTKLDNKLIELDGTPNKSKLGANAILGVSLANVHIAAKEKGVPLYKYLNPDAGLLPVPMMNIINGGKHADSGLNIQEFMIMPVGAPNFKEALRMGTEVFHSLKKLLSSKRLSTAVGDEGGFAPNLSDNEEAFTLIIQAIENAKYKPGEDIVLAIDAASSEFYNSNRYSIKIGGKQEELTNSELIDFYSELVKKYPIVSIEDGLSQDDWEGWKEQNLKLGDKIQLVGDDFFVTNTKRIEEGIKLNCANSVLIKLNQIGTLTETDNAIKMALDAGWTAIVSHRSGETEDTTIADYVVGRETGQIKTGSLSRTERICKYNQLLRIEEELGDKAKYLGKAVFKFNK